MTSKIDFARVKAEVPIDSLLAHYGIQTKRRDREFVVCPCPLPTHSSKDSKQSFAVNVVENWWICHSDSCQKARGKKGGDVIDLVCLLEGTKLPLEGAKKLVELFPQYGKPALEHSRAGEVNTSNHTAGFEKNKPLAFTLKDIQHSHPMFDERSISEATAREFGAGYFPGKGSMAGRIVFPIHEDGFLVAYIGRTTLDVTDENPKWKVPQGFVKSMLYGLERATPDKPIILCESVWGVLYFAESKFQAAALMGKELTAQQEERLKPFGTVILALDNDEPGKIATEVIAAKLRPTHKVLKATLKEG